MYDRLTHTAKGMYRIFSKQLSVVNIELKISYSLSADIYKWCSSNRAASSGGLKSGNSQDNGSIAAQTEPCDSGNSIWP